MWWSARTTQRGSYTHNNNKQGSTKKIITSDSHHAAERRWHRLKPVSHYICTVVSYINTTVCLQSTTAQIVPRIYGQGYCSHKPMKRSPTDYTVFTSTVDTTFVHGGCCKRNDMIGQDCCEQHDWTRSLWTTWLYKIAVIPRLSRGTRWTRVVYEVFLRRAWCLFCSVFKKLHYGTVVHTPLLIVCYTGWRQRDANAF